MALAAAGRSDGTGVGLPSGSWGGGAPQLLAGIVVVRLETRPSPEEVGGWGAPGHRSGVGGLAELLCGEGTLVCRETIERSVL